MFLENIDQLEDEDYSVPENKEFENFVYSIDNLYL